MRQRRKTMRGERGSREEANVATSVQRRRERRRDFMRRWRADPAHREIERERRDEAYLQRELRGAERSRLHPYNGTHGQLLCGFCGLGRPVEIVERLRILQEPEEGYIKVFVPYCGHC